MTLEPLPLRRRIRAWAVIVAALVLAFVAGIVVGVAT